MPKLDEEADLHESPGKARSPPEQASIEAPAEHREGGGRPETYLQAAAESQRHVGLSILCKCRYERIINAISCRPTISDQ